MKKNAVFFAAVLAGAVLSGCSEKDIISEKKDPVIQTQSIENVPEPVNTDEQIHFKAGPRIDPGISDIDYINEIEYKNGRINISGSADYYSGSSGILYRNIKTPEEKVLSLSGISSPDYISVGKNKTVVLYSDGSSSEKIAFADIKTGKIISSRDFLPSDQDLRRTVMKLFVCDDGRVVVICSELPEIPRFQSFIPPVSFKAAVFSDNLELINTIDLTSEDFPVLYDCIESDGYLYIQSGKTDGTVHVLCKDLSDGEDVSEYELLSEYSRLVFFKDNEKNICLVPESGNGEDDLYCYTPDSQEKIYRPGPLELEDYCMASNGNDKYSFIYVSTEDGNLYGYDTDKAEKTLLCENSSLDFLSTEYSFNSISITDDEIYILYSLFEYNSSLVMYSMKSDGSDIKKSVFQNESGHAFSKMCTDEKNDIYGFISVVSLGGIEGDQQDEKDTHLIYHFSGQTGRQTGLLDLSDVIGSGETVTADWLSAEKDGNICLVYHTDGSLGLGRTFLLMTDSKGKVIIHQDVAESCNSAFCSSESGILVTAGFDGIKMFTADPKTGTVSQPLKIDSELRGERVIKIYPGDDKYDFYCSDIRNLYGYKAEENIFCKVFSRDFIDESECNVTMFCPADNGQLFCQAYDSDNGQFFCTLKPE